MQSCAILRHCGRLRDEPCVVCAVLESQVSQRVPELHLRANQRTRQTISTASAGRADRHTKRESSAQRVDASLFAFGFCAHVCLDVRRSRQNNRYVQGFRKSIARIVDGQADGRQNERLSVFARLVVVHQIDQQNGRDLVSVHI